jgi:hypothetical protein
MGLQDKYTTEEGTACRGRKFGSLVEALVVVQTDEPPLTERELLELLGPPDFANFTRHGTGYVYLFADKAPKDHAALIGVDEKGIVDHIGFNIASAVDLRQFKSYKPWPEGKFPTEAMRNSPTREGR